MALRAQDARPGALDKRMEKAQKTTLVIGIIVVAIFAIVAITSFLTLKFRRPYRTAQAAKPETDKLPSLFSWKNFRKRPRRNEYSTSLQDTEYRGSGSNFRESREMSGAAATDPERSDTNNGSNGVDRHTSVRSVMTLPPYAPAPREDERVLGREGERAGMDNVIELPETVDDEEGRREQEMESLYQIRLARRIEAADREARRQARRDARARGDVQALADIRRRTEEAADLSVSQMLIAEHQNNARTRERRVSSVAYGDLGVARHDGTRLRANSTESDNRPLLDSAASISGQSHHSRAYSGNTLDPDTHRRGFSVTSFGSRVSDDYDFSDLGRPTTQSQQSPNGTSDDFEVVPLNPERSHSGSRTGTPNMEIPREQAPAYEDPPTYESPVQTRAPQLPNLERLPSIHVTPEYTMSRSPPR
ncbi:hypothetical protein BDU57DRAFT_558917 [Ampelomyces quisqualis]|uniref:Uncharacterized protein n=1 Tax=Ampelomyces quisqualis TaxID=50730 RepID=A0A6A5QHN3_AMPQU|nr:hypothetical protein BDU57DRAFT_558917 [Ampelomyces quisqualis]